MNVYQDQGVSGLSQPEQRPGLITLLQDARDGKFDVLYLHSLDCFGRNAKDALDIVTQLQAAGIKIMAGGQEVQQPEHQLLEVIASFNAMAS